MYCARTACWCSSVALPIKLSQAWIPSLPILVLLGIAEGQLHPLGFIEQMSGLWLMFKGSTVHRRATCNTTVLLLPVGEELSG